MIVCVTPNPAVDITYRVAALHVGSTHRVVDATERAGGKGVNVASVLVQLGRPARAVLPLGSDGGAVVGADLSARGIPADLVPAPGPTRRSVAVVDDAGAATVLNEAGSDPGPMVWLELMDRVRAGLDRSDVLVVSGSLPEGADPLVVRELVEAAVESGARSVLDISGDALRGAIGAGPTLVKPNLEEARATLGVEDLDAGAAAAGLRELGARAALVSTGAGGLVLRADGVGLAARLSHPLSGNPTGAGDALTAALAATLHEGDDIDWPAALRRGISWSAAAVLQPLAGDVDPSDAGHLLSQVVLDPG